MNKIKTPERLLSTRINFRIEAVKKQRLQNYYGLNLAKKLRDYAEKLLNEIPEE